MELIVLCGIPASGKSTLAKELSEKGYIIHSSDELRKKGVPEHLVFNKLHSDIKQDLKSGFNCIYDATNLTKHKREKVVQWFKYFIGKDLSITCMYFEPNLHLSLERNNIRNKSEYVPVAIIKQMYHNFKTPSIIEGFDKIIKMEVK